MTRLILSNITGEGPRPDPTKIIEWVRGPSPFRVVVTNMGKLVYLHPSRTRGAAYMLAAGSKNSWPNPEITIEVPAAVGGVDEIETEGLYFTTHLEGEHYLQYRIEPSAGNTRPRTLDTGPDPGTHAAPAEVE